MAISSILPTTMSLPTRPPIPPTPISSLRVLSPSTTHLTLSSSSSSLLLRRRSGGYGAVVAPVRMGGGPRTFPGGVSKWQWKRMQAKKGKQLLKARLCRERQIYEMRKRAELRSAAAELERPWEAPPPTAAAAAAETLFSVSADEQVKALADRFRRPGGFDAWNDRDGPQIFRKLPPTEDCSLPSARFFPKGAVHSLKPYGITNSKEEYGDVDLGNGGDDLGFGIAERHRRRRRSRLIDAEITDSIIKRDSSRSDSDDDALSRNGDQMSRGIDRTVHRNSRLRNSRRARPIDAEITDSTIKRDSSRSDSDDDALSRNGDQMRRGIDRTVHRNSRLRNSRRSRPIDAEITDSTIKSDSSRSDSDDDALSRNGDQMRRGIDKTVHRNSRLRNSNSNSLRSTADLSNLSISEDSNRRSDRRRSRSSSSNW